MHKVDLDNTSWSQVQIQKLGWPTISLVGKADAHHAWLLAQHVESKKPIREFLELMTSHLAWNEVSMSDCATITDRVLIGPGKMPVCGTQARKVG